jgi:hypothetical protein
MMSYDSRPNTNPHFKFIPITSRKRD